MVLFLAVVVGRLGTIDPADPSKFHHPQPSVMPDHGVFSIRLCCTVRVSAKYAEMALCPLNNAALYEDADALRRLAPASSWRSPWDFSSTPTR